MTTREPMTHEIVRNVLTLVQRLAKHTEVAEQLKTARALSERELLDAVRDQHAEVFNALGEKVARLSIANRDGLELFLCRNGVWNFLYRGGEAQIVTTSSVLEHFTVEEVIAGLVAALADRIEGKHEKERKLARANRRLRGILSILDNS